jgi:hypothetical protein
LFLIVEIPLDWSRAIARNREALLAIVTTLAMLVSGAADRVPWAFHRAVVRVLGPAEAAVRRLIVMAARGLGPELLRSRAMVRIPAGRARPERLAFPLFDRRKCFTPKPQDQPPGPCPRIHVIGGDPRLMMFRPAAPPEAAPRPLFDDGLADTHRLRLRLDAVAPALGDLTRQARRLARWRVRREQVERFQYRPPLRPGPPPGHRRTPSHEVDFVLRECHGLAWDALALDTS